MKLVYLPTAAPDMVWMRLYYRSIFPQGGKKAREQFYAVEKLIVENPYIGHPVEGGREFPISHTPFRVIYRLHDDAIEVLRSLGRSARSVDPAILSSAIRQH